VGQYAAYNGQRVKLTFRENQLFGLLLRRFGQIVHRDVIWSTIWKDAEIDPKIVDVYVCKINHKIRKLGLKIKSSWGIGRGLFFADPVVANVAKTIQDDDKHNLVESNWATTPQGGTHSHVV